jgi:ABC-type transporter Mla subunit MlaD
MATRANYVKLGLFVVIGVAAATALVIATSAVRLRRETISYVTYFDESVQGLEVSAPVEARGVLVGRVGGITFAPDHQMVEVRIEFDVASLVSMGMLQDHPPPEVRAQLGSMGLVSGRRFIALDTFDPQTHPGPRLSFAAPARYIPSTPSVEKNLETLITKTLDRLSILADAFVRVGIAEKSARAVTDLDDVLTTLDGALRRLDRERLPARAANAIDDARVTIAKLNETLERVKGRDGLLTSAQHAAASVGEVGRNASAATRDLQSVLDEVHAAATAIRELAEQIEQNPDMLIKGRRKP